MPAMIISTIGGPISPSSAASAPGRPAQREPYMTEKFRMLPPGSTWHSASCSLNSSGVSQPRSWTMMRRDHASTPPKPHTAILAKARKSSAAVGMGRTAASAGAADGGAAASGSGMVQDGCVARRANGRLRRTDDGRIPQEPGTLSGPDRPAPEQNRKASTTPGTAAAGSELLFFCQPLALIFRGPAQAGYGDKWPS